MTSLKIAIFAQLDSATITEELVPILHTRGHMVDIIDLSTVAKENFSEESEIQALTKYNLVYYRSGLNPNVNPKLVIELEAFLKTNSIKAVNLHYTEHPQANSKSYETKQAQKNGLIVPKSIYTKEDFSVLNKELGLPYITKTDRGTQGHGVHLVHNESEFTEIINLYPNTQLLFQEFIPHDFEYRVFIIAGEVVSLWKKAPATGGFRSNEAQGGEMFKADPEHIDQLIELAKITYATFGFEIFVADFMLHKDTDEFYFTEINLNPGWSSVDNEAGEVDHSALTADYLEKICS